jgi:delta-1-pyrroline-5-carboxylate synthetase
MDSKVNAATWALDRGVSVVICNGMQDKAIKTIISGRKVGTFFTDTIATGGTAPVDILAENGTKLPLLYKYNINIILHRSSTRG